MLRDTIRGLVSRLDRLLVPSRTSVYPLIVLLLWLPAWAILISRSNKPLMIDLVARWTGGGMVARGNWSHLYDPAVQAVVQRDLLNAGGGLSWFVGPPFEAVSLAALGILPYGLAVAVWTAASVGCLLIALWLLRQRAVPGGVWWRRALIVSLGSKPVIECVFSGQNSTFILLAIVLAWIALRGGRDFIAGALLGLALVKPHLVFLLALLWLLERRWRALAGLGATATAWIVLVAAVLEPSVFGTWMSVLSGDLYTTSVSLGQTAKHAGLAGLVNDLLGKLGLPAGMLGTAITLTAGMVAVGWVRFRESDPMTRWWIAVLCSVVFAPHAMVYDLVIVIPSLAVALSRWWTSSLRVALALTWIGLWVTPPISTLIGFAVHGVLVTGLALLVVRHAGRDSVMFVDAPALNGGATGPQGSTAHSRS